MQHFFGGLARAWRLLAGGCVIAGFILVVAATVLFVGPASRWISGDADVAGRRVRRFVQASCAWLVRCAERLGVLKLTVDGAARLREPGRLVVSNHPTSIDALVLLSLMNDGVCVTKNEHWDRALMRRAIAETRFIFNNEGTAVVDACVERLEQGASVLLFPEASRSPAGGLHPLQRGASYVALRSGRELLPVVLTCDPPAFRRDAPWYRTTARPLELDVRVLDPIAVEDLRRPNMPRPVAARQITSALRELYEKTLEISRV